MKKQKYWLIIILLMIFLWTNASPDRKASLTEIYTSGSIRFVPELTIDDNSLPEDVFLESAIDIVTDKNGNVYICDYKANNIKKFDSSGKYLKVIGRAGQGPGEFNRPFWITVSNNRLVVWDMGNRRLCALTQDGEFIKSVQLFGNEGRPNKMRPLPNGDIVIELENINFGDSDKPQDCLIAVYSPDLEKKEMVYTQQVWRNKYMRIEGMFTNIIQPFSPLVCWDISPEGNIVIGYPKKYEIEIYKSQKGKVASFTHPYKPIKVTDKDKKMFFAGMTHSIGGVITQGAPEHVVKNTDFPKLKPAFKQIIVDSEGNILVWTYRKNKEKEAKCFDAFNPEGNFIGNVQIIGDVSFPARTVIKDGSFWLSKTDEEGLIKAVKYRASNSSKL